MGTWQDFQNLLTVLRQLDANRVIRFGYTEEAFDDEYIVQYGAAGQYQEGIPLSVETFPNSIPSIALSTIDPIVQNFGYRQNSSSLSRRAFNHLFGRTSFNLNKLVQKVSELTEQYLVNKFFAPSGMVVEYLNVQAEPDKIILIEHKADVWFASAPVTSIENLDIFPAEITTSAAIGQAGVMLPLDKQILHAQAGRIDIILSRIQELFKPTFISLWDTPDTYIGQEGKFLIVDEFYAWDETNGWSPTDPQYSTTRKGRLVFKSLGELVVQWPEASPPSGTIALGDKVSLFSNTLGAEIYYTTDGYTDPTAVIGTLYTGPITVPSSPTVPFVIRAIAYHENMFVSSVSSHHYFTKAQTLAPVSNIPSGPVTIGTAIVLSSGSPSPTIYYTMDGSDPDLGNVGGLNPTQIFNAEIGLNTLGAVVIKAMATSASLNPSAISIFNYQVKNV